MRAVISWPRPKTRQRSAKNARRKIVALIPELDREISEKLEGWKIGRLGKVELAILRLALYEIRYDDDVPTGAAINEAVELAKKFGQDNSGQFINGILAKFARQ